MVTRFSDKVDTCRCPWGDQCQCSSGVEGQDALGGIVIECEMMGKVGEDNSCKTFGCQGEERKESRTGVDEIFS